MFPRFHLRHCAAFALTLMSSCLCHGQVTTIGDEPSRLAQPLNHSERHDLFSAHGASRASLRELLREPRPQTGARSQREGMSGGELRDPPFVSALRRAWKRGVAELALEGYGEVLIQCQKQQSPAATTALMRSDSQQAHCFRF